MNIRRVRALAKKEFIQMRRDVRSLVAALFIPLLMIFLYGYALTLDVDQIRTVILDRDRTPPARDFIHRLIDSRYFKVVGYLDNEKEIDDALARGEALMALVVPEDFAAKVNLGKRSPIQAVFDGSDANTASIAVGYLNAVTTGFDLDIQTSRIRQAGLKLADVPVELRARVWFNAELKSRNFIIPGLTAIIMMIMCALLTALTVTQERETRTLEQLIATPISSGELMLGKLLPYLAVGLVDMAMVVGFGVVIFQVPFRGSYLELFFAALLFLVGTLSWGLFISVVSKTQLQAAQISLLTAFLPSLLLSGFIYPIDNMPVPLQILTYVVPARYFVEILKGLFLQGIGLNYLWPQFLALIVYAVLIMNLARKKFTKRLI